MLKKAYLHEALKISEDPKCPLCRFYAASVGSHRYPVPMNDTVYVTFYQENGQDKKVCLEAESEGFPNRLILPLDADIDIDPHTTYAHLINSEFIDCRVLKGWLMFCQINHERCSTSPNTGIQHQRVRRFIDCFANEIVAAPPGCEYAALSYVWGGVSAPAAIGKCLGPLETPLQTIKDAMVVTAQLQIRYLWVDQYCIDQSDSSEMHSQLSVMDLIYSEAAVTIVAAAGTDASSGLPGVSRPRTIVQPKICLNGTTWISCLKRPEELVERSRWYTRAWTYQERVCSRRRLIFTPELILFECATSGCDEANDWGFYNKTSIAASEWLQLTDFTDAQAFMDHISRYTARELSYQSDALNAMRGVFRIFSSTQGIGQHWGIPTNTIAAFADGLSWGVDWTAPLASRRKEFPSWSWAGWMAPILDSSKIIWPGEITLDEKLEFEFQKLDGTMTRPHETFGSSWADDTRLERSVYTLVIRVTSEVLKVHFTAVQNTHQALTSICRLEKLYAAVLVDNINWPFEPTGAIDDCPQLKQAFFTDKFDVIVLPGYVGIVVWQYEGCTERIGVLHLNGFCDDSHRRPWHLRKHVPSERKSILLC
jgi:hypothetical protein